MDVCVCVCDSGLLLPRVCDILGWVLVGGGVCAGDGGGRGSISSSCKRWLGVRRVYVGVACC